MKTLLSKSKSSPLAALAMSILIGAACASSIAAETQVTLTGKQEVPPVTTKASGSGTINVADDRSVSGSVKTKNIDANAAHIHEAPAGKNGPVIVPLSKTADGTWSVATGSKLTDEQYKSYKAGNLYVNVHSAAHPDGEIRGQIKPK